MPAPQAHIVHRSGQRIRLKVPDRRRDSAFFQGAADDLIGIESVVRVEANPLTASVLIHFVGNAEALIVRLGQSELFCLNDTGNRKRQLLGRVRRDMGQFDKWILKASAGEADLATLAFILLSGSGLIQCLRGNLATPAVTLLWYAASLMIGEMANGGGVSNAERSLQDRVGREPDSRPKSRNVN